MSDANANQRGIFLMVAGTSFFAANDACSKLASAYMPTSQIMALRGLMAAAMLVAILALRGQLHGARHLADRRVLLRSAAEGACSYLYIAGLAHIGLATSSSILQVAPLVTMAAAVLLAGTNVGWRRWAAVATGFAGVLLVMKPGSSTFQLAALLPLVAAFLASFRDFTTGRIARHVPTLVVALSTASFGMTVGFLGSGFEAWQALPPAAWASLLGGALTLICGHMLMISAFRGTDPSVVAPFRYANVPFAVTYGALIFGMWPDAPAILGMALIVAAGVYTVRHQRRFGTKAAESVLEPAE